MAGDRRLALVTGATAGIGLEIARGLARSGHDLVLVARREDRLRAVAEELASSYGVEAHPVALDLTAADGPSQVLQRVEALGRPVDVLVNNAGFGTFGPFHETDAATSVDMVQLNVAALTHLTGLVLPGMVERDRGRIMNVASTAAFQPGPLMAVYYATKAYVLSFSEALAEELADTSVVVNCLCPGPTRTEFQEVADMEDSGLVTGRDLMDAATVAEVGLRGLERGERVTIPGFRNRFLTWVVKFAPRSMVTRFVKNMQARTGER